MKTQPEFKEHYFVPHKTHPILPLFYFTKFAHFARNNILTICMSQYS